MGSLSCSDSPYINDRLSVGKGETVHDLSSSLTELVQFNSLTLRAFDKLIMCVMFYR